MSRWKTFPLGEVASIERSAVQPADIAKGTVYLGLEHIAIGGAILGVKPVDEGELASSKFKFTDRHLLYGKLRPYLAKIACPDFSGICSTDILPVLPGPNLDRSFLCHFLRQPKMVDYANSRTAGANLPRLSPSALAEIQIPLPTLDEQRRIAAILDKADAIRRRSHEAVSLTKDLLNSVFLDMFGDPVTNPKGWNTDKIINLCHLVRGSSPRPQSDPRYYGGNVPRLMVADLTRDGWLVTPQIDSLTEEGAKLSRPVKAGTIVMAVSGNVGVVSQLAVDACIHDGFVAFTDLNRNIIIDVYLMYCLHLMKITHEKRKAGAIFQNLTTNDIKNMEIMIPDMTLQKSFSNLFTTRRLIKDKINTRSQLIDELFQSLSSRAFRGDLQ